MRIKMQQCDGTVRYYDQKPWWLDESIHKQQYRDTPKGITKAEKISARMSEIARINREGRAEKLLDKGIVVRQNENGIVVIRNVGAKLERV